MSENLSWPDHTSWFPTGLHPVLLSIHHTHLKHYILLTVLLTFHLKQYIINFVFFFNIPYSNKPFSRNVFVSVLCLSLSGTMPIYCEKTVIPPGRTSWEFWELSRSFVVDIWRQYLNISLPKTTADVIL